jgi:hypothetical protein
MFNRRRIDLPVWWAARPMCVIAHSQAKVPCMQISCAKCAQIPICESPYAIKYCSNTPKMNFLRIYVIPVRIMKLCAYGD